MRKRTGYPTSLCYVLEYVKGLHLIYYRLLLLIYLCYMVTAVACCVLTGIHIIGWLYVACRLHSWSLHTLACCCDFCRFPSVHLCVHVSCLPADLHRQSTQRWKSAPTWSVESLTVSAEPHAILEQRFSVLFSGHSCFVYTGVFIDVSHLPHLSCLIVDIRQLCYTVSYVMPHCW